jgi:chromosome segregation ATPase
MPSRPSTRRVYVWRKLKSAGAIFLHQSAFLLPSSKASKALFEELEKEVKQQGGQARVLAVKVEDAKQEAEIVAQFNAQSEEEYGEFIERCDDLHAELTKERGKNHYSFAELEENDAEVKKLKSWLSRIQARDFFSAPLGAKAVAAFVAAIKDFSRYENEVTSREVGPEKRRKVKDRSNRQT